ncbi:MAG: ATP-binding cassette domain-containing protein [Dongiaceae bacterium]
MAVDDISFSVRQGEIFAVMGLSGSGKSTLVRCLNRLVEPTSGSIRLDPPPNAQTGDIPSGDIEAGDITGAGVEALRQIRLRRIAMVFQHFALLPHRTVAENTEYGLKARGMGAKERRERAHALLAKMGLRGWADAYPRDLSGGMQQRVGLARALAVEPEVLLMDEPFSALDPLIRREMQDQLLTLQDELRTTIVFITHDLQEALKLGGRIAIMKDGRFVQVGSAEAIVSRPGDDYIRAFTSDVDRSRVLTPRRMMQPVLAPEQMAGLAQVPADAHLNQLFGALRAGRNLAVVDTQGRYVGLLDPLSVFEHLGSAGATEDDAAARGQPWLMTRRPA